MGVGKKFIRKNQIIISNPKYKNFDPHIQLMRITLTNLESKFDFGYRADDYYSRGGWIKISPDTFIRAIDHEKKYKLINATNIPYGPERYHFNSTIEWRYFSLFFPPLPDEITEIDLIENELRKEDSTEFNFFNIRLNDVKNQELIF
jgi:hypothetical protein